ncbi:MAG TPA: hypothetical protein VFX39_06860 [Gemmatimonadaceae bacterium]|nr:hypothetical protein [Gemmatimonadaceae bacterium]
MPDARAALALLVALVAACTAPERVDTERADTASSSGASPAVADSGTAGPTVADSGVPDSGVAAPADTGRAPLLARADSGVAAIARRDWSTLAALAHPARGVRFSPYGHVEPEGECAVTLTREQVASLATDSTTRCWGHFDGSGEPMRLSFPAYYARFVYEKDYARARRGEPDERLGQGNTLSNLPDAFGPGATFVEYHVPGTEQYGGMDWGSLRLVFVPTDGEWRLVGVVHDQWTI